MAEAIEKDRVQAVVHWLVVGPLHGAGDGAPRTATAETFASVMEAAGLRASVEVEDRVGSGDRRTVSLSFPSLRSFGLKDIVASVPELSKLIALSDRLTAAKDRLEPADAPGEVEAIVGAGKLRDAVAKLCGVTAPAKSDGGSEGGDVLSKADLPEATPKAAVDRFISSMRTSGGSGSVPKEGRSARNAIEEAVYATAADLLRHPDVACIEAAWRGLHMLAQQCPERTGMHVELIDVPAERVAGAIRARPEVDAIDQPDAIFVPVDHDDPSGLVALAEVAEEQLSPVITGLSSKFFGAADAASVQERLDDDDVFRAWEETRAEEPTRWLTVCANPVLLMAEGAGSSKRTVFGSPVWALASMVAASFGRFGSFARILGQPGALKGPATWILPKGRHEGNAAPTEAFFPIRVQATLEKRGIVGVGSNRNGDSLLLSAVPTARSSEDAVPLPAQILTGRIVRFAGWVRDQVPSGASSDDVANLFHQAAGVFLFPGLEANASLGAEVKEVDGKKVVMVAAKVGPEHALIPFSIQFDLPLGP